MNLEFPAVRKILKKVNPYLVALASIVAIATGVLLFLKDRHLAMDMQSYDLGKLRFESGNLLYLSIDVKFINPTETAGTATDCKLSLTFNGSNEQFESIGYATENKMLHEVFGLRPDVFIAAGKSERREWRFFFVPLPELEKAMESPVGHIDQLWFRCEDTKNSELIFEQTIGK